MNILRLRGSLSHLLQFSSLLVPVLLIPFEVVAQGDPAAVFTGVSLSVASPTVPPGGTLQMQVSITEPKPILKASSLTENGPRTRAPSAPARLDCARSTEWVP